MNGVAEANGSSFPSYLVGRPRAVPQSEFTRHVAESLSAALCRRGLPSRVLTIEPRVGDAEVDALLVVRGAEVAVEFVGYMQADGAHQYEFDSWVFAADVAEALNSRDARPRDVALHWRDHLVPDGTSGRSRMLLRFPKHRESWRACRDEIVRLVVAVDRGELPESMRLEFGDATTNDRLARVPNRSWYVDRSRFPAAAYHLRSLRVEGIDHGLLATVSTGTSFRMIGLDSEKLRESLNKKQRRADAYRIVAAGRPLWLLVHENGWPASRRLPELHREKAYSLTTEILGGPKRAFDRVFWLHDVFAGASATVVEVK